MRDTWDGRGAGEILADSEGAGGHGIQMGGR